MKYYKNFYIKYFFIYLIVLKIFAENEKIRYFQRDISPKS